MGIEISSMLPVTDLYPFPGKAVENDLYWVDSHAEPSCGIDIEDGTDWQATRGFQRSHPTSESEGRPINIVF
jgi:hypothetical protein